MSKFKPVLVHHGIKGMRWGVRRYQNEDGSYTAAGKKRYSVKDVEKDIKKSLKSDDKTYTRVKENGPKLQKATESLLRDYKKAYTEAVLDEEAKARVMENVRKELGDKCDDKRTYDFVAGMYASDELDRIVESKVKAQKNAFEKLHNEYRKDIASITDGAIKKYGGQKIKNIDRYGDEYEVINDIVTHTLNASSVLEKAWNMPSNTHGGSNDLVSNSQEYRDAVKRFDTQVPSMKDYNAWASKR